MKPHIVSNEDIIWIENNLSSRDIRRNTRLKFLGWVFCFTVSSLGSGVLVIGGIMAGVSWWYVLFMGILFVGLTFLVYIMLYIPNDPLCIGLTEKGIYWVKFPDLLRENENGFVPWRKIVGFCSVGPEYRTYTFKWKKDFKGMAYFDKGFGLLSEDCMEQVKKYIQKKGITLGWSKG